MSSTKDYLMEIRAEQADKWIRERLNNKNASQDSEEYQSMASAYDNLREYLEEKENFEAEYLWLRKMGSSKIHKSLIDQLDALEKIVKVKNMEFPQIIYKMSFTYAVTLLETYLSDTAKSLITESDTFFKNAIAKVEELKKARYSLDALAEGEVNAKELAVKELSNILYHNIPKVVKVLESILNAKIKINIDELVHLTNLRHDIAHRNGYTKEGEKIVLSAAIVSDAIKKLIEFTSDLQKIINESQKGI
ncbi:hypothetical protein TDB9533_01217 [Thalassocella blandensis]|nr:hypothetical protein TDB9533_01217 [Thalassocella blandensis]